MRRPNDPLLDKLLSAPADTSASVALEELLRCADPVITTVIGYYRRRSLVGVDDAEEIASRVRVRLLLKLRRLRDAADEPPIASFTGYVAGLAYNTVHDLFRERHPERAQLTKQLREVISASSRVTMERSADGLTCRLVESEHRSAVLAPDARIHAVERLLHDAGGAMRFHDIVNALDRGSSTISPPAAAPEISIRIEQRSALESLWQEIRRLRPLQRAALMLNLRDDNGGNAVALFLLVGIATFDEVADTIGVSRDDLTVLWNDLPLDDLKIAARLGITRQNVINLRQAARQRLSRKMR